jgi:hypothetical protein
MLPRSIDGNGEYASAGIAQSNLRSAKDKPRSDRTLNTHATSQAVNAKAG